MICNRPECAEEAGWIYNPHKGWWSIEQGKANGRQGVCYMGKGPLYIASPSHPYSPNKPNKPNKTLWDKAKSWLLPRAPYLRRPAKQD